MSRINIKDWTPDYYLNNRATCNAVLENPDNLIEIPSLNCSNIDNFRDGQLVRYLGMVQDICSDEYTLVNYVVKNIRTGEYYMKRQIFKDSIERSVDEHIQKNSSNNEYSERKSYFVISIPGLNDWAKEVTVPSNEHCVASGSNLTKKRSLSNDEPELGSMADNKSLNKKSRPDEPKRGTTNKFTGIISKDHLFNFPIPIKDGKVCIVKVYQESNTCVVNEVIETVAFLSLGPMISTVNNSSELMRDIEGQIPNPPASVILRLHAIKVTKSPTIQKISNIQDIKNKIQIIRGDLHMILSQLLFGDNLAAEYLICHLISSVHTRKELFSLGNFPLNITNFPDKYDTFPKDFYDFLTKLIPKSHYFECTLDALNKSRMIPKKDYNCQRLISGILQLSNYTHLIVDETKLTAGQISANGRLNYAAISYLVRLQKVKYDFKHYTMDFHTDIPVIILSQAKSFIPLAIQIPLRVDCDTLSIYPQVVAAAHQYLSSENRLNNIRQYLELCRIGQFNLYAEMASLMHNDFFQLRNSDTTIGVNDLYLFFGLARLMALSNGEESLSLERWHQSFELETERLHRLPRHNMQ